MQRSTPCRLFGLLWALASAAVAAADAAATDEPSSAPALAGYRPFDSDEPPRDWRTANDEAGRLGGHVGQLAPRSSEATPPSPAPSGAAPQPHSGHGGRR